MGRKKTLLIIASLLFAAVLLLSGCGGQTTVSASDADVEELSQENQQLKARITELEELLANTPGGEVQPIEDSSILAVGINCMLYLTEDGADSAASEIKFQQSASISAVLDIPSGKAFDYWLVNGQKIDTSELIVDATTTTIVEAVVRDELTVTAINADIQLMQGGSLIGDKLKEYNFENEQVISLYVSAVIPSGYEIDYWIFDGHPYHFSRDVAYFKVFDLDRTTTYEAVLKAKAAATAVPASPTAPPAEMVTVTCINATFSGGGYSGASSGQVEKGTTITVTGTNDIGNPQYWLINGSADWTRGKSFSYTVNSNRSFEYTGVN